MSCTAHTTTFVDDACPPPAENKTLIAIHALESDATSAAHNRVWGVLRGSEHDAGWWLAGRTFASASM